MKLPTVVAEFDPCGGGRGPDCCIYLVAGSKGFECAREDAGLKATLDARHARGSMVAARQPGLPFPACQREAWKTTKT